MARYVDGFVIPVKKKKVKAYKKMATIGRNAWMKFGALDYYETVGDDLAPDYVTNTFKKAYKLKPDETVVFAFIVFKSKAHRNAVNKKVHKFFSEKYAGDPGPEGMPFDMKKYSYAGFKSLVNS